MDFIYNLIGAFIGTWIIYNIFHIILFYFLDKKTIPYVSFIGSFIIILVITTYTIGFVNGFIIYIPVLFLWFVIDLIKMKKMNVKDLNNTTNV
jgi:hypothetical protein